MLSRFGALPVSLILKASPLQDGFGSRPRCHLLLRTVSLTPLRRAGGGNDLSENLLFQTCDESGDHGPINTWDRQAFITTIRTGKPSTVPAVTEIHHNFIVSDGAADGGAVDNDDGSSYYSIHHNFGVYGGAKMDNIGGHSQTVYSNFCEL